MGMKVTLNDGCQDAESCGVGGYLCPSHLHAALTTASEAEYAKTYVSAGYKEHVRAYWNRAPEDYSMAGFKVHCGAYCDPDRRSSRPPRNERDSLFRTVEREFTTMSEASAFREGIEYFNDREVGIERIEQRPNGKFTVIIVDKTLEDGGDFNEHDEDDDAVDPDADPEELFEDGADIE